MIHMTKLALALLISACILATDVTVGTEFTLKKGQTASVKRTRISVKVISAGTVQHESGGDSVFCKATIKVGGNVRDVNFGMGRTYKASGHTVTLTAVDLKTDPKLADPWSNISCSFIVTKGEK